MRRLIPHDPSLLPCGLSQYAFDAADNRTVQLRTGVNPPVVQNELSMYRGLLVEQELVSLDGRFRLRLQGDGNLVLYFGSVALWSANTAGSSAMYLEMSSEGGLYMFPPSTAWAAIWGSGTGRHPGAKLVLQNDGNADIYDGSTAVWQTGTGGNQGRSCKLWAGRGD